MRIRTLLRYLLVLTALSPLCLRGQVSRYSMAGDAREKAGMSTSPLVNNTLAYLNRVVSLSFKDVPVREALSEVSHQTGVRFSYNDDLLRNKSVVRFSAKNLTLVAALNGILDGSGISWLPRSDDNIVLLPLEQVQEVLGKVAGVVRDTRTGEGIPSANVIVEGTGLGASTDEKGGFTIDRVPAGSYKVTARSIGFKKSTKEVVVAAGQSAALDFSLETDVLDLDEVVVTGMSVATERRKLGNAISTLNAAEVNPTGTFSIDRALVGKVTGAQIQQNSGAPDGGVTVRLRGTASVLGSADPLYIMDGVIINNESPVLMFLGGYTQNRLIDINPNDIERIEVVKGAAAAALYGSQANNGVVQIFTKRGTEGKPRITYSTRLQMDELRHRLDLNTAPVDNSGNKNPDGSDVTRYDWQDFIFRKAMGNEQYLSISGGTPTQRYFTSGSYLHDQGILKGTSFERMSGRASISQFVNDNIDVSFDANYIYNRSQEVPNGGLESSYGALTGLLYGPNTVDPRFNPTTGTYPHNVGLTNPIEVIDLYDFNTEVGRFIGSAKVEAKILPGLTGQYTLGYDTYKQTAIALIPIGTARASVAEGFSRKATRDFFQVTNDAFLRYLTQISSSLESSSLLGGTVQYQKASNFGAEATRLTPATEIVTSGSLQTLSEFRSQTVIYGAFAQQSFTLDNRLTVTGGVRLDASSVFGKNDRTQFYPKASISYLVSDESFWQDLGLASAIPSLKLRAAFGESGGLTAIGAFDRYTIFNPVSLAGKPGLVPASQLGAANIKPERQRGYEAGLDMSLLGDRVGIEFTYYNQHTTDLLLFRSVAPSSGFLNQLTNAGILDNNGIEFGLRVVPMASRDFRWTSSFSYAANRNRVDNIEGGTLIIAESFGLVAAINGQPLGVYYGSAFQRDAAGNIVYNSAGIPQRAATNKIIGDPNPRFTASWINEFDIMQNLFVRIQFDAVYGNDVFNFSRRVQAFPSYGTSKDYEKELTGQLPKGYNAAVYNIFENWIEDGSYVKCREVSVSYRMNPDFLGMRSLTVTLAGRNLFSIDKYDGYDPETNVAGQRTAVRGFDFAEVPIPRGYSLSLTMGF